jgi:hypothetical protein
MHVLLRLSAAALLAFGWTQTPGLAQQTYPERAVRFILPFGPGSATDIAARLIGEKLQMKWGKPVTVEPRPGGDGLIAINAFLAANDDHTLLYASTASFIVHPYTLQSKPPYDAERDLNPIVRTADSGLAVALSTESGAKTLRDFVELARKNPGTLNVAGGAGLVDIPLAGGTHGQRQAQGAALPGGVEQRLVVFQMHRPEAVHAAHVMHAVHAGPDEVGPWAGAAALLLAASAGKASPVPIIESRVTKPANCSRLQPSVPGGRMGTTR